MNATGIPVARIAELGVARTWQEVVAVIVEAGEALGRSGAVAAPADAVITSAGDLQLDPSRIGSGMPGDDLRELLALLLEGQAAPNELRALATTPASPGAQGIESLLTGLAYFERPNRRADIAALAVRALAAESEAIADSELGRLRRATARNPAPGRDAPHRTGQRSLRGLALVVAGGLWFLVGVAAVGWFASRTSQSESPATANDGGDPVATAAGPADTGGGLFTKAREAISSAADAGLRAVGLSASDDERPAAVPPAPPVTADGRKPRTGSPRATEATPLAATPVESASPPLAGLSVVSADPPEATTAPLASPEIFSETDTDVDPPKLVYPQLPVDMSPATIAPGSAYFELLVNEEGTVERVRLLANEARFQDRMLVSAAKAWRFEPARRDGRPVRYLLRAPTPP